MFCFVFLGEPSGEQRSPSEFHHRAALSLDRLVGGGGSGGGKLGMFLSLSLSARFVAASSPFPPGQFDENGPNCSRSIRLVQGFPTLVSVSESEISFFPSRSFPCSVAIGSLWIRLVRIFPTRVSSLLSAGFFCFPFRRFTFDGMSRICSLLMRLVQGVPTLVSL
jgi:hypothetical protein